MIGVERRGAVTVLRIERHAQRNALDQAHCTDLLEQVEAALAGGARALVLTGEGTSFCSGADLDTVHSESFLKALYALLHRLAEVPVPVIAAVNGPAIGAGTQLAIAADLRVAAPTARFAVPTARLGFVVDAWTMRRLAALAGGGAARAVLVGVEALSAERAHGLGLVDRLGGLDDALAWAEELSTLAPLSIAFSKRVLNTAGELDPAAEELEAGFWATWSSEDSYEGVNARAERRPPEFRGR